ncbi:hypothetical protein AALP_AA2G210400 [Arabis alpina]|uniref:Dienelactone hydrolase domain-containing protein n=1 Tax=Arabis alpina TaxID=50452 RepID=A0A087HIZ5_ARAAL|nr:hypothetical protein AALP_AA2G210400 [Arabis alpina]
MCMGGALAIASSVLVPEVDAVVGFCGTPSSELADPAQAKAPIQAHFGELADVSSKIGFTAEPTQGKTPIQARIGEHESSVGFSDITAAKNLEEKLKASGIAHEVHIYSGNEHAFLNRKSMELSEEDEAAVALAWSHFSSWMKHYLA